MIKKLIRAGCYVRVSTENQLENYSIEEQIERLKAYCSAKDWEIYKIYTDGGYSGGNTERPALKQMLNDINDQVLDIVIVYKLDRLSRSQKDTLTLIEDNFLCNNVEFVSISENFDTTTPFGRAMIGILSVFAQLEKDQITERFTMGRIGRGKAGYYHGGAIAPTGYNYTNGELVVDEYKSMQVQEVFNLFLSGNSINSIQRKMNEKYGGWTSHTLVLNVLRNCVYIGKVKFKKQVYDGIHKPIISIDMYNKAQLLLGAREQNNQSISPQRTPFRANYLLSSLIFCEKCGAKYSANHGYYKCYSRAKSNKRFIVDPNCQGKNWRIDTLDCLIINELRKLKQDNEHIAGLLCSKQEEPFISINAIDERIKGIDMQISKIIDLYQINSIPIEDISSRINVLQKEKSILNERLKTSSDCDPMAKKDFRGLLNVFDCMFMSGGLIEEQRLFLSSLIGSIIINDEQIKINWRI